MELNFKSILKMLNKEKKYSVILENIDNITSLIILCSISVVNPAAAIVASIGHSLLIKDKVSKIRKSLIDHFKDIEINTSIFEMAYVLIHFTSFFDALSENFPDLIKESGLTETNKKFIIKKKLKQNKQKVEDLASFSNYDTELSNYEIYKISDFNILKPNKYLIELFEKLTEGFIEFIKCLVIWDELNETQQEKLVIDIRNIKGNAINKFENQLTTLSSEIDGFDKWLIRSEHKVLAEGQDKLHKDNLEIIDRILSLEKSFNSTEFPQFINKELEKIKLRIDKKYLQIPLEDINIIEDEYWDKLTPNQKFKIITYKAKIFLIRSEIDSAASLFIESYKYDKNDARALFNIAYGYYLKKDFENASKYNDKILRKYPENADANTIKILLTDLKVSTDDLIKTIPESLYDIPKISFHIAEFARNKKEYESAFEWYETSIKKEKEITFEIKAIYAKSLIEFVLNNDKYFNRIQLPEKLIKKLEYALILLNESWDYVKNSDIEKLHLDWLSDIALIHHLLNASDEALIIINKALEINNGDALLNRNKAIILYESGKISDSIPYFEKVLNKNENSDIVFNLSLAYFRTNQNKRAIEILLNYLKQEISDYNKIRAERTLFDLYFKEGNLKYAEEILKNYTNKIYQRIDSSILYHKQGDIDKALLQLTYIEEHYISELNPKDIFELANGFFLCETYKKSSFYYSQVVDIEKYSPMLNRLIDSYRFSNQKKKAFEICKKIRKKEGFIRELFSIETTILDEIGDLPRTIEIYEDALKSNPEDYHLILNLAIYYLKQENYNGVKSVLEFTFDFKKLTLDQGFQLAYLYAENKKVLDSFELIYELRRKFYNEQKAHLQYAGFFFSYDNMLTSLKLIDIDKVTENCAVLINENGQNKIYILDNREDIDLIRFKEIGNDNPLYLSIVNKRKNDEIEVVESPFSKKKIRIIDIFHKYVYALRETLDNYNDYFPEATGMYKISLELPNDGSDKMEALNPILKGADQLKEKTNYFENLYMTNPIPISFISQQSGFHIFDVMFGFASNEDIGIRCCEGNEIERQKALRIIKFEKKIVIDMTSIFTIHHLKMFELIKSKFDLVISQSTLDELDELLKERKISLGKEVFTISKIEDKYTKTQYSAEQNTRYYDTLMNLKKWLQENCNIQVCDNRFDIEEKKILELEKTIGKSFTDSILLACDKNFILLSDDLYIRKIAEDVFKINGIWSQALLIYLNDNSILNDDEYQKYLIDLVCMNYLHTSINYKTIIKAAKLSHFNIDYPLSKVLSILNSKKCDEISALRVVDKTMYTIYSEVLDKVVCTTLINGLLNFSTENRDAKQFVHSLMTGATVIYRLHPIYLKFILGLLRDWLKSKLIET